MTSASDECKRGVDKIGDYLKQIQLIIDRNKSKTEEFSELERKWKKDKQEHDTKMVEWESRKERKKTELRNEIKLWEKCIDGNFYCSPYSLTHEWCANEFGQGWYHTGCEQSNCGIYRKGRCQRTSNKVDQDLQAWENSNPKPIFNEPYPTLNTEKFPESSQFAINCCSSLLNAVGSNIDESNINQLNDCYAKINSEVQQSSTEAPKTNSQPTSSMTEKSTDNIQINPSDYEINDLNHLNNNNKILLTSAVIGVSVIAIVILLSKNK